jgi:phenylacetic acid degradation protein
MTFYSFKDLRPVVHATAFVHRDAVLIGDVHIGEGCYVGPNASLRGDFGRLVMEKGSNLQDNCVMHSFPGHDCIVGRDAHIGHGAILHGCTIGQDALIGMNCVIMDYSNIGEGCIVGALSFVKAKTMMEPGTLWIGSPAKYVRQVTPSEREWKQRGTSEYQELARQSLISLVTCEPLQEEEKDRKRLSGTHMPLTDFRVAHDQN